MGHVFHRHTKTEYPTAVKGDGVYVIDKDGNRYLDGCCGAAVSSLGHSNAEVADAIKGQLDKIAFTHTGFYTNEPMEELADFLTSKAPGDLDRVYFVSGGSEAVEAAIKMSRQYFLEIGKPEKSKIIARWQSYHGNTLGALSAGGNKWRRNQFEPLLIENMKHIPPCYEYRLRKKNETEEEFGIRIADRLEEEIVMEGASTVAAFIVEPVVGATMGCVPAVKGYFKRIREICDKYDVLLILDEVMCGMGRTGNLFSCEHDEISGDIITLAKGLGAGYASIGAVMVSKKIFEAIQNGTGFFQHGHTYMGHPLACAASLKVQQIIERDNLVDKVNEQGAKLRAALEDNFGQHPNIGDIRGRGLFLGMELVQDRETKKPFAPEEQVQAKIKANAMAKGLMVYAMPGTIDGKLGAHLMFAPPFIIEDSHIDEMVSKLSDSVKEALA
jgi:adenosylmethionine-8-amino-7-oxononanoate aminotransferase